MPLSREVLVARLPTPLSYDTMDDLMDEGAARHLEYALAIEPQSQIDRAWYTIFALLSANTPMSSAVKAYSGLLNLGRPNHPQALDHLSHIVGGLKRHQWACEIWQRMMGDGECPQSREDFLTYRGLGLAKASFAAALQNPTRADVACIDTHMYRMVMGCAAKSEVRPKLYNHIEDTIRGVARRHGYSTFVTQWTLWDALRGTDESHGFLRGEQ